MSWKASGAVTQSIFDLLQISQMHESNLGQEFFDLRSGLAGELFQKSMNYRTPLAIVISDPKKHGDRFSELAHEHRRHPFVRFFPSKTEARAWLEANSA